MPTKHIDEPTWRKIEKQLVKAVTVTKRGFKDAEILKIIINKGIENISEDDYLEYIKKKG